MEESIPEILAIPSLTELRQMQLDDGTISPLLTAVTKGGRPTSDAVRRQGPEAQYLAQLWDKLLVEEGVLKRRYVETQGHFTRFQLVVP